MKRKGIFICILLCAVAAAAAWGLHQTYGTQPEDTNQTTAPQQQERMPEEIRAVWIYYNELSMQDVNGGTKEEFTNKAEEMTENIRAAGLNTVILQVRPFCDAFYPSALFPWSAYLTGTQGQGVDYDPLEIFLACAKEKGLSVQAWFNPYRVLLSTDWDKLADTNPAKQWYLAGKTENLLLTDTGIYLNPASKEAQALILDGVRELLTKYDLDAVHIDDYFYPTTDESVDSELYAAYTAAGGKLSLSDWRRENVNTFLSGLYAAVKATDPSVHVVVSPGGDLARNYETLYADVARWAREPGFVDVLMPQLYYGFENESLPFSDTAAKWAALELADGVQLCFGLAAYKCGKEDAYAGTGKAEWQQSTDILSRQLALCRGLSHYGGFAIYSYSSIFSENSTENAKKEWQNLKNMLQ